MKTYIKIACQLLLVGFLVASCEDLLNQSDPNKATDDTFWQNENDFNEALTSCYTPLKNALNGGYYGTRGVMLRIARADEVKFRNDIAEVYQASRFTNSNSNGLVQGMFYQFYNALYRTNTIMQKLSEKEDQFSTEFQNKVTGECLFIRGFYLFQLAKEFKDVPLRLTASQSPSTFPLAKSSQADVWTQAKQDLATASGLLSIEDKGDGKPTKGAALAVLGKIYVYEKDWSNAVKTLKSLTEAPYQYKLADDYYWNFDEAHENEGAVKNPESIFELFIDNLGGNDVWGDGENVNSTQSNSRAKEYAANQLGGWYEATVTQKMMNIFLEEKDMNGNSDYRARCSVAWNYPGCMYYTQPFENVFKDSPADLASYWILKYQNWKSPGPESPDNKSYINERAIRYADVLLLLAEAQMNTGDLQSAIGNLNLIRKRAGLNDYSEAMTNDAVFADIKHQRAIEFFVEGERFYDLRRWDMLSDAIKTCDEVETPQPDTRYNNYENGKSGNINKFDYYPIPAKELDTNLLCTPSEGW